MDGPGPELEPVPLPSVVSRGVHRKKSHGFQHGHLMLRWMSKQHPNISKHPCLSCLNILHYSDIIKNMYTILYFGMSRILTWSPAIFFLAMLHSFRCAGGTSGPPSIKSSSPKRAAKRERSVPSVPSVLGLLAVRRFQAQQSFFRVKCQWSSWKRKRYGFIMFYPFFNQLDS